MGKLLERSSETFPPGVSITEAVFNNISGRIRSLDLVPGAKLSEADVARQFGISRQPVRDAFHQLSKLGFLIIRPQRATEVSLISPSTIIAARFLRTSVEVEMVRRAASLIDAAGVKHLENLLDQQRDAISRADTEQFKLLDDRYHLGICEVCDLGEVWTRIAENKAHTDRLRLLSIRDSSPDALRDHELILEALKRGDAEAATAQMREHLDRIKGVLEDLRRTRHQWFSDEDDI